MSYSSWKGSARKRFTFTHSLCKVFSPSHHSFFATVTTRRTKCLCNIWDHQLWPSFCFLCESTQKMVAAPFYAVGSHFKFFLTDWKAQFVPPTQKYLVHCTDAILSLDEHKLSRTGRRMQTLKLCIGTGCCTSEACGHSTLHDLAVCCFCSFVLSPIPDLMYL